MKTYDNKKIYNFKTKHKRKRRTGDAQIWWRIGSSKYTRIKRRAYRNRCKEILRKKLQGQNIEFPLYRKTLWWDP